MIHQVTNSAANNYNAFIYRENIRWDSHFHKSFELIYSIEGTHSISVGQTSYRIDKGEFILIPPNTVHAFQISKGAQAWVGVFSADFIADFAGKNSDRLYSKFRCEAHIEEFLQRVLLFQGTPERYILKAALYAVCSQCRQHASILREKTNTDAKNAILQHISENFCEGLTMRSVAEALGYEYHYFSGLFHRCFSMNFKEFLNFYRVERACELMAREEHTLARIAMESGFQSIRSFNNSFKAVTGITPTEYKKTI